jgi:REP element-mobilizing transposase RayT
LRRKKNESRADPSDGAVRARSTRAAGAIVLSVPRLPRYVFRDGTFHAVTRGAGGIAIYRTDFDRRAFVRLLGEVVQRHEWNVHAFCLMTNHYHLVVEALRDDLSDGFHRLNGIYAQAFNRRHARKGHLFGDRFWCGEIETEEQLATTCRYVLANPVRAGICRRIEDWRWSGSRYGFDP